MEKKLRMLNHLQRTVAESAVESKAVVKVWREIKNKKFTVKLGELEKYSAEEEKARDLKK